MLSFNVRSWFATPLLLSSSSTTYDCRGNCFAVRRRPQAVRLRTAKKGLVSMHLFHVFLLKSILIPPSFKTCKFPRGRYRHAEKRVTQNLFWWNRPSQLRGRGGILLLKLLKQNNRKRVRIVPPSHPAHLQLAVLVIMSSNIAIYILFALSWLFY